MFSINISLSNILKTRDFIQVLFCVRCVASQEENMLIYSTVRILSEISWQFDGVKSVCIIFYIRHSKLRHTCSLHFIKDSSNYVTASPPNITD